jgi:hypothetical protein
MEHFLLLVPGPLPGCIFMRHIILALFTVWRDFAILHKITDPGKDIAKDIDGQLGKLNKLNYLRKV